LLKIIAWFASTEGIYALHVLVVSLALCAPAVIRSSAGFYYREKGLWGVIIAQLSMVPYTADLVYGVAVRIIGTVVGGAIGMVAWYIGAGKGPGNPYGMAVIIGVVIIVFMWWRLFSPPLLMPAGIMAAATAYLVVAYSWVNTHIPSYGNTAAGYPVFSHRLVLVLIGFAAAIIVNFLPRPPSANRHYRRLLAESLGSARDRYALFSSSWADPAPHLTEVAERETLAIGEVLFSIAGPIKLTRLEFSTSNINADTLSQVCQLCMVMNQNITQLLLYTARLSPELKMRIISPTGASDKDLVIELMAVLTLVQQALKTGDPLPAMLHTPLFAKSIEIARRRVNGGETAELFIRDGLGDEGLRKYVSVLNSLVQFLGALDELVLVLKRAVGESSDVMLMERV
jgi:Aromatic acid exporter family member 2/Fusaric acid resistance protein-like